MNYKAEYVDHSLGIRALHMYRLKEISAKASGFDDSKEDRLCEHSSAIMALQSCGSAAAEACLPARDSRENQTVPQQPVDDEDDIKSRHVQVAENVHVRTVHVGNYACSVQSLGAPNDRPFGRASIGLEADDQVPDVEHLVRSVQTAEAVAVDDASQQAVLDANERLLEECVDGRDDDSTAAAAPLPHGTTFLRELGKGQFGFVSLVKRKVDGMLLASKQVRRDRYDYAEYNLLALCHHENIVRVVDLLDIGDWIFLLLEYQQGLTLNVWKANTTGNCPVTEEKLDLLGLDMLNALQHLEQRRILHRDIKPSNIVVTLRPNGEPKFVLIDFGLSQHLPPGRSTVCTVKYRGTPAYSAPECFVKCRALECCSEGVGTQADMWSVGVVITEMCCKHPPWLQPSLPPHNTAKPVRFCALQIQHLVRNEKIVRCSPSWRDLLVRMIAHQADERPRPEDLLRELNEIRRRSTPDFAFLLQPT